MLKNYFKVGLRNIFRFKLYNFINILGLAFSFSCCVLVILFMNDELSFDKFHQKKDYIYRVSMSMQFGEDTVPVFPPAPLGPSLMASYTRVENYFRLRCSNEPILIEKENTRFTESGLCYSESSLFELLDFTLILGDQREALDKPYSIVLSTQMAEKYFPGRDPVGESLQLNAEQLYEVTGVLGETNNNTHLDVDFIVSFATLQSTDPSVNFWVDGGALAYIMLKEGGTAERLESEIVALVESNMESDAERVRVFIERLEDIYLSQDNIYSYQLSGDPRYLYIFPTIALLILIIASINYMNLMTAQSIKRGKVVGVRKVLGAERGQLVRQFLGESILVSLLGYVLSLLFLVVLLPWFNIIVDKELSKFSWVFWLLYLGFGFVAILIGSAAGSYPAMFLSSFKPIQVLKGSVTTGVNADRLRRSLVAVQFTISVGLVVYTIFIWRQVDFIRNADLGFDKENVILVDQGNAISSNYEAFKQEVQGISSVVGVTTAPMPGHTHVPIMSINPEGFNVEVEGYPHVSTFAVDGDFINVMNIDIIEGRPLDDTRSAEAANSILVNEAFITEFGWQDPISRTITMPRGPRSQRIESSVVGVISDFHNTTKKRSIEPLVVYLTEGVSRFGRIIVKLSPNADLTTILGDIEAIWGDFAPGEPFNYSFLDEEIDEFYKSEIQVGLLFSSFSLVAILLACMGLFAMASLTSEQRTKEIGIRKVLGASIFSIIYLLVKEYYKLLGAAFIIAFPLTYIAVSRWLEGFAYKVSISIGIFILVAISAMLLTIATVSFQTIKAALTNPVKTMRHD